MAALRGQHGSRLHVIVWSHGAVFPTHHQPGADGIFPHADPFRSQIHVGAAAGRKTPSCHFGAVLKFCDLHEDG